MQIPILKAGTRPWVTICKWLPLSTCLLVNARGGHEDDTCLREIVGSFDRERRVLIWGLTDPSLQCHCGKVFTQA